MIFLYLLCFYSSPLPPFFFSPLLLFLHFYPLNQHCKREKEGRAGLWRGEEAGCLYCCSSAATAASCGSYDQSTKLAAQLLKNFVRDIRHIVFELPSMLQLLFLKFCFWLVIEMTLMGLYNKGNSKEKRKGSDRVTKGTISYPFFVFAIM